MTPSAIETATFRFVAQHLNHSATAVPQTSYTGKIKYGAFYDTGKQISIFHIPYFSIDNAHVIYTKRPKFVKNEHARYTLGMKKGKNLERLITATSQALFRNNSCVLGQ